MTFADVISQTEQIYKEQVMQETWGHLAPKKNKRYNGYIIFATGCFGEGELNPIPLVCEFGDLDSSPWFYDHLMRFLSDNYGEPGCVYRFDGYFKNYEFVGEITLLNQYK